MSFFKAAQRGDNAFSKYVLTIIGVILASLIGQIPLGILVASAASQNGVSTERMEEFQQSLDFSKLGLDPNLVLPLMLLPFAVALGAFLLLVRHLHHKRLSDVFTGRERIDWGRVAYGFGFWFLLTLLMEVVMYAMEPEQYVFQLDWKSFLPLVIIAVLMFPLQTTFEEVIFRGYLMQGFGLLAKNRLLPLILTSAIFGGIHFANPEVQEFGAGLMMAYYIGFGLLMGVCTLMDDGIELAMGLHAATNIYGAAIVSFAGSVLQTPTIFRVQELDAGLMLLVALFAGGLFILFAARRYNWTDWSKLYRPIEPGGMNDV